MTDFRNLRFENVHTKALTKGEQPGTFEAIGALFGNIDRAREVLDKGSLEEAIAKSLPAVVWSHDWLTPPVGVTLEMSEVDRAAVERLSKKDLPQGITGGLYGKGRLFVDEDIQLANHIYTAMKSEGGDGQPPLKEWSVGLSVKEAAPAFTEEEGTVIHLSKCELPEWGPCLRGVNNATFTLGTKSDDLKNLITKGILDPREMRQALDLEPDNGGDPSTSLKGALPVTQLGFTDRDRPWDAGAAKKRVHDWAKKEDGSYDAARLKRSPYLWVDDDGDPTQVTSYRFIVGDLVNGTMKYVPRGIFAAAGVLNGARGGTTIGAEGVAALRKSVDQLYARMRKEFDDDSIVTNWKASPSPEDRLEIARLMLVT